VTATERNGKRVLVVDDVATTRSILRKILSEQGYEVIEADSGEDAIKMYHAEKPDAVTMDIHLAKVSGLGAIQVILRIDPGARIIVCSAEYSPQYVLETLRMGAKAYIAKPFTTETVMTAVAKAFAS